MDYRAMTDETLMSAFAAADRRALAELARRYELKWLGLARGLLGGRDDLACDAVQEAYVRIIRFASGFDGRCRFKTWAYRILFNQCLTMREANSRHGPRGSLDDVAARLPSPCDIATAIDDGHRVRCAVAELVPAKRDVLLMCYHEGLTHEDAALVLDIPIGTLKSRLSAALAELRAILGTAAESEQ